MVLTHNFQDIFDVSSKTTVLNLPTFKESSLKLEFENSDDIETVYDGQKPQLPFAVGDVFQASISEWRRLTALTNDVKTVYEVTFDITGSSFSFEPGDTIGIIPHNPTSDVDMIIKQLELDKQADLTYTLSVDRSLKGAKIPHHVPIKSTLRHVLKNCLDLRSVVKKLFILALSRHTKDENERKVLEYICSREGSTTYSTHVLNKNLCILDVFTIFKTCKPPIEVLLANLPRLLPRPYSVVNSTLKEPENILKICFSVMDLGNNRKGLTTGWLEKIFLEEKGFENKMKKLSITGQKSCVKIPIYLRNNISGFRIPSDLETPMILIGPGTGVAPFVGFLEECEMKMMEKDPKISLGEIWLFFGCRNSKLDFIYEDILKESVEKNVLNKLFTAFSREGNTEFKYVQDALLKEGENLVKLINNGASIFVCGDQRAMAAQVKEVLVKCLVKHDGRSLEEAEKVICDMQRDRRYLLDIWS